LTHLLSEASELVENQLARKGGEEERWIEEDWEGPMPSAERDGEIRSPSVISVNSPAKVF
jgi:hypothetical protein